MTIVSSASSSNNSMKNTEIPRIELSICNQLFPGVSFDSKDTTFSSMGGKKSSG